MERKARSSSISMLAGILLILALGGLLSSPADAGTKRIAILDFDDAAASQPESFSEDNPMAMLAFIAAQKGNQKGNTGQAGTGQLVASLLTTELVKDGTYKVLERSQLQSILKEQNLSTSGVVDAKDAAKLGKVLGVNAIVTGSITEYNVSSRKKGILGIGVKTTTGKVALNARMIDTTSGEILFASDGSGEESDSGIDVGSIYSTDSANYGNTLLGKSTKKALENIIREVVAYAPKLKDPALSGLVAYYDNATKCCYLDLGKDTGIEKGQTFYVSRVVREIKNPTSGEVIKRITDSVAELKVTEVEKGSSTAICVLGKCEEIKEKDVVSSIKN